MRRRAVSSCAGAAGGWEALAGGLPATPPQQMSTAGLCLGQSGFGRSQRCHQVSFCDTALSRPPDMAATDRPGPRGPRPRRVAGVEGPCRGLSSCRCGPLGCRQTQLMLWTAKSRSERRVCVCAHACVRVCDVCPRVYACDCACMVLSVSRLESRKVRAGSGLRGDRIFPQGTPRGLGRARGTPIAARGAPSCKRTRGPADHGVSSSGDVTGHRLQAFRTSPPGVSPTATLSPHPRPDPASCLRLGSRLCLPPQATLAGAGPWGLDAAPTG